ncbi:aquaporin Z [Curtobacterium flaccumfaciens]|uniref:Aquaporin Z n=1 Tax=Curtobacterium flaccumfaciens TaxID=2035 RepID=A0A4R6DQN7_9MICO|nr:aquaporin [Curtobacterium flaccumfaciens]TDN46588.1 aquaporin Z [Curtobacterium flaccumfaciens]
MPERTSTRDVDEHGRPPVAHRLLAEAAGTAFLVLAVAGTALFDTGFRDVHLGSGFVGVALALGISVFVGASAFGPVSGGHCNPAVTVGLATAGRFRWQDVPPYVAAQVVGAVVGGGAIALVAAASGRFVALSASGFASTGWGPLSPGGFGFWSAFSVEAITTGVFVAVVLIVTRRATAVTPLVIGLTLTAVALIAIPVSNGSFNPARSIGTAVYGGPTAAAQVWLSLVAPTLSALVVGAVARVLDRLGRDRVR